MQCGQVALALLALHPADVAAQVAQGVGGSSVVAPASHLKDTHATPVPTAAAAERTGAIVMDGKLDDAAWQAATPVTQFTQTDPEEGKPASERIEVRFLFDNGALYVGAKMYDKLGRKGVTTNLVRRDDYFNSDFFEIVLDGYHDHLSQAFFQVNPAGSKSDRIGIGSSCCDYGWDPVWEAATKIDDDGWTAEIRIPLSQLRFQNEPEQTWGLQIGRWIQRNQERDQWSFWKKSESGGPNRFGHLEGMRIRGAGSKHVELMPYAVGKGRYEQHAQGDPFNTGHVNSARVGVDLKYLLTSNLTLNAAINPDFGQVEVDPAVVNLSAFETFFPEKRPFFIEGSSIFGFGGLSCYFCSNTSSIQAFYSRRVGRAPTGADLAYRAGQYADVPDAATILGAGKITGRTANGFTIGVLEAVTGQADAKVQLADGSRMTQEVEPLSNYFVGRVKKDLQDGNLLVGGIVTSVARRLDDTFAPRLAHHAELYGTDFRYTWKNRAYSLVGQYALSSVDGDARLIASKQRMSARYFQRPDRDTMSNGLFTNRYDTTLSSLRGGAAYMRLGKDAGDWLWEGMVNVRTPGFDTNDYSFLTTADYVYTNANLVRNITKPGRWYRSIWMIVGSQQQQNWSGDRTDVQVHSEFRTQTPQFWFVNTVVKWKPELFDDRLLRGGPVVKKPGTTLVATIINTDSRSKVVGNFEASYSADARGGWESNFYAGARFRPSSNTLVSFNPSWSDSHSLLQFVQSVTDLTSGAFYGKRYVMSALKRKALGLDTRLDVTFSPAMTLQLYAQPFIASGEYVDFKEFNAPCQGAWSVYGKDKGTITKAGVESALMYTVDPDGAGAAAPFTIANPDFNLRSLRGNAVFRWEYLPGSILYVAWTHSRFDQASIGDFDFSRDRDALFATKPDNIFLVKASWWLAR